MRTKKQVTVDLYGALGVGHTQAEAKTDAARRIACAFRDGHGFASYSPKMLRFPNGAVGLLYRDLAGWNYSVLWPGHDRQDGYSVGLWVDTQREAERSLRRHMAQLHIFETDDDGMSLLLPDDEDGRKEHARYLKFQVAYRQYKAEGKSDHDCHRLACEAMWAA